MYAIQTNSNNRRTKSISLLRKINSHILEEDIEILETLEFLKEDLGYAHECIDNITDPLLIDSYIYQIQSLNKMYEYYVRICKERGIIADIG